MRATSFVSIAMVCTVLAVGAHRAAADQNAAQAESLFNEAKKLMAAGKVAEACDAFAASERLDSSPSTLMNLADCREKNHQYASAWEAYVAVQRKVSGDGRYGKMADIANQHALALEPRLSYLTINVADEVRVEGLEVMRDGVVIEAGAWNRALPVDGGEHTISGRAPGVEQWLTKVTVEPEHDKKQVEVPKFKALRNPTGQTIIVEHTTPSMFTRKRKIAIGVAGAGVVAAAAGAILGLRAQGLQSDADSACPPEMCTVAGASRANDLNNKARTSALMADVGFGVGVAAVGVGAYLWLTGKPHPSAAEAPDDEDEEEVDPTQQQPLSLVPQIGPSYVGLQAAVRF